MKSHLFSQGFALTLLLSLSLIFAQTNPATGFQLQRGHTHDILYVGWDPDGKRLISYSGGDDSIRLWDPGEGKLLWEIKAGTLSWDNPLKSPDESIVAFGERNNSFRFLDATSGRLLWEIRAKSSHNSETSPDGKIVAEGGRWRDAGVRLFEAESRSLIRILEGHPGIVFSVAFSPDNSIVASGNGDRTAKLWDARTGHPLQNFEGHTESVTSVSFSPDGSVLLSGSKDGTLKLWEVESGKLLRSVVAQEKDEGIGGVKCVAFSPNADSIASGSGVKVKLWNAASGKRLRTLETFESHSGPGTHGEGVTWCCGSNVFSTVFSPDGSLIVSGHEDGTVKVWNVANGKLLRTIKASTDDVRAIAFSPDGRMIVTVSMNKVRARCWNIRTGKMIRQFGEDSSYADSVAFSPDGILIATGEIGGGMKIWNAKTGRILRKFDSGFGPLHSLAFSRDGSTILAGGQNQDIQLWDVKGGKRIWSLFDKPVR